MKIVTASGTPVWVQGRGPTVILVHGVLMDHRMWDAQVAALRARYRVCCMDMLGHGEGPDPPAVPRLADFVRQVDEVVRHFSDGERPALVGFSMGGLVAQSFAVTQHARLGALVLLNTVYDRSPEAAEIVRGRSEAMRDGGIASAIESARARWFSAADVAERADAVEAILDWMRAGAFGPKARAHRVFAEADGEAAGRLGAIGCPTLVMTGADDAGSTPDMARRMAQAIDGAELLVLDAQRHMMPVLDAPRVNAALLDFLDRRLTSAA